MEVIDGPDVPGARERARRRRVSARLFADRYRLAKARAARLSDQAAKHAADARRAATVAAVTAQNTNP